MKSTLKKVMKKDNGGAGVIDHLPVIILVIMAAYILLQSGYYAKSMEMINRLNDLAYKYSLIMQSTNGLEAADVVALYDELEGMGIGISDVSLDGTTFADAGVEYGDKIYLKMNVKVPFRSLIMHENMGMNQHVVSKEVSIVRCGIALG